MYTNEYMLVKKAENTNLAEVYRRAKGNNPAQINGWEYLRTTVARNSK